MATYLVGGSGYGGLTGPVAQSILLGERIASNIGLAGEQELMGLAYNQNNIVVTLAGNTRFYIVLQEPAAGRQADIMPTVGRALARTSPMRMDNLSRLRRNSVN